MCGLQVLIRKITKLLDKNVAQVKDLFSNHTLFNKVCIGEYCMFKPCSIFFLSKLPFSLVQQALKEAFEVFCNKAVAGRSSAELLAASCDNILHKGGNESDEDIEEKLEKVCLLEFS